jgi:hypothetical protein
MRIFPRQVSGRGLLRRGRLLGLQLRGGVDSHSFVGCDMFAALCHPWVALHCSGGCSPVDGTSWCRASNPAATPCMALQLHSRARAALIVVAQRTS